MQLWCSACWLVRRRLPWARWATSWPRSYPHAAANDLFGWSVAISGNIAVVGAVEADYAGWNSGSAYLFDVTTGSQLAKLTADDAAPEDLFGNSVAISGNTAIVGALYDDGASQWTGSAYLFDVTTGGQLGRLNASDTDVYEFGRSVAISGNTAIVGSDGAAAYLFDVTTGGQVAKLIADDPANWDYFGYSVAISANTAIVGAGQDDDAGNNSGSAYLFDVTTGDQLAKLTAADAAEEDYFGMSVAISGNIAIVGAHRNESAYLFDLTDRNNPIQIAMLTADDAADGDEFGRSVGISGNTAIVGAADDDSAYLFDVTTGSQLAKLTAATANVAGQNFGLSVGISGNTAIVGAFMANGAASNSGMAFLFDAEVPEPSTLAVLVIGGLALIRRRRK